MGTNSVFRMIGASNHVPDEREKDDFYATDPIAMEVLLEEETFSPLIWECACGAGHLAKVLVQHGYKVITSDLVDRGCGGKEENFLNTSIRYFEGDIITNPPYKYAKEFVEKALEIIVTGNKVAMFLKLQFLEGKARKEFFKKYPPKTIFVSSSRIVCAKNGEFDKYPSSAIAYAWFVWEKGFQGDPIVKWIN